MNFDYSLLDAVLGRASEGLRVLEDIARFAVLDRARATECKNLRHSIIRLGISFGGSALLGGRFVSETSSLGGPVETRHNLLGIIRANAGRATEALRTLEEFAPLYAPSAVEQISEIRYRLYSLETELAKNTPHFWLESYNVGGFIYPLSSSEEELIAYINAGARVVQLRDKDSTVSRKREKLLHLTTYASEFNRAHKNEKVLVIVNDDLSLAAEFPVAGVHLGQDDRDIATARRVLGSNKIIGRSNNTIPQLKDSISGGVDYVSFGPTFATPNKPDRTPTGLKNLGQAVSLATVPLVAIGGIHASNIADVYATGARNMAVISAAKDFFG